MNIKPSIVSEGGLIEIGGVLIIAAGFEDRSRALLDRANIANCSHIILIKFVNGPIKNDECFNYCTDKLLEFKNRLNVVNFDLYASSKLEKDLLSALSIQNSVQQNAVVNLDISALPTYAICMALKAIRDAAPFSEHKIWYTEAKEYYPTQGEFDHLIGRKPTKNLPDSLTSEMSENLILESFSGFPAGQDKCCLIVFAGFERHRTVGVIDSINPSKLGLFYCQPEREDLSWRLQMSKFLHKDLPFCLETSEELCLSTDIEKTFDTIQEYYDMLYDDYSLTLSPINSKLHTVACFLLWERCPDVQITFPIPVKYLSDRFSNGVGQIHSFKLPQTPNMEALFSGETSTESIP